MDRNEQIKIAEQMFDAVCVLVQRADLAEADAARLSGFYPIWDKTKSYGNNTWLRYGANAAGKPLLYTTTRNVAAGGTAPDVTPGSYRLIG